MYKKIFLLFLVFICGAGGFELTQYPTTIETNGKITQNIDKSGSVTKTCNDDEPGGYGYKGCFNNPLELKVNEAISLDLKSVGDFNFLKVKNTNTNSIEVNVRLQPDKIASPLEYDIYQKDNKSNNGRRLMLSTFSRIDLAMLYDGSEMNDAIEAIFAATANVLDVYGAANSSCRGSQTPEVGVCFNTPVNWTNGEPTDVSTEMNAKMTLQPGEVGFIIFRTTYTFDDGLWGETAYPSQKGFYDNKSFDGKVGQCQAGRSVTDFKCWADAKKTTEVNNEDCTKAKNDYINTGIRPQGTQSIATFSWSDESCATYDPVESTVNIEGITITTHPSTSLVAKNVPAGSNETPVQLIGSKNLEIDFDKFNELSCRDRTNNRGTEFTKVELYDGNDVLVQSSEDATDAIVSNKIKIDKFKLSDIEIPNKEGKNLNYKQMYLKTTCNATWGSKDIGTGEVSNTQNTYFDARPARLLRTTPVELKNADKLYAQYSYGFEANGAGNESIEHLRKFAEGKALEEFGQDALNELFCDYEDNEHKGTGILQTYVNDRSKAAGYNYTAHYDTSDFNNKQIFEAIDVNGDVVKGYDSARMEVVIASKLITADEASKNLPCKDEPGKCQIGYIQLNGGTNVNNQLPIPKGIYTDFGTRYALEFKHIGPTQIFGHDSTWTVFSRDRSLDNNALCIVDSASNIPNVNGIIGCDIGLSEKSGAMTTPDNPDEETIDFYTFTPAAMKMQIELKNSPINNSYGTDKWTYISNIQREMEKRKSEGAVNNRVPPFESADLNVSVYALGANKNNFCSNTPSVVNRFTYSADLKVHDLNFAGSPKNPYINKADPTGEIFMDKIQDFSIKALSEKLFKKDELAIYKAEISRPQKAGFNHEFDYVVDDFKDAKSILESSPVSLDRPASEFLGGKNIGEYRLNFIRNDLLARNYVNIKDDDFEIISDETTWNWLKDIGEIAIAYSLKGDLTFVDAAMIAPDFANNTDRNKADQAVYLAGYCDSDCDKAGILGEKVPNHITYNIFSHSPLPGADPKPNMFKYEGATFKERVAGADMINGFTGDEVSVLLQDKDEATDNEELKKYCEIFRNCVDLGEGKYGLKFKVFGAAATSWHGAGEDQGTTILDNANNKRHRPNNRLGR